MADYDAKIRISADTADVDRKLSKLEKQLAALNKKGGLTFDFNENTKLNKFVAGFENLQTRARAASQDVLNLGNNFKNFGRLAATSGLGAAYLQINQLGVAASNASSVFGPLNSLIKGFGAAAQAATPYGNAVVDAIRNIGITSGTTAAEIALATAAFMAFSPVLKRAAVDTLDVAKAGIAANQAIGNLVKGIGVSTLTGKLNEALEPAENLRRLFQRQLDTRTELEKRVSAMNTVLNQHNAFSQTGLKILEKTLELEKRLTEEVKNQQTARRSLDPGASRKLQIEQRIAAIRRGEIGGNEAFREYSKRATAISDAGTRDLYQRTAGVGKYAPKAPIANMPLALPSTELLDPVGRGIKRITEYSGEYTATLDKGVAAGQRFTQSLKQADTESLKLQGDLKALELVLSRVTNSLSNVGVRNQFAGKQVGPETRADYYQRIGVERKNAMMLADREAATEAKINAILEKRNVIRAKGGGGLGQKGKAAIGNAAVGGAFPLLFGQSGAAAAGGAIGGLLGSTIPGLSLVGGFGGSLIGTILGEKLGQGDQVKQLGEDIGFSTEQTKLLAVAFEQAGREFDKFQASVQNIRGLSLSIDDQADAINLVSTLTKKYGGQIDKVTNAFTSALESGKVTQATLNQLTNQGIQVQKALADKYKVSGDAILQMAKDGKISVQDLTNTLIDMGNKGVTAVNKPTTGFAAFMKGVNDIMTAIGNLASAIITKLTPAFNWLMGHLGEIISSAAQGIQMISNMLSGGDANTTKAYALARKRLEKEGGPTVGTRYLTEKDKTKVEQYRTEELANMVKPKSTKIGAITVPGQLPATEKKDTSADKAAKAAEREAERVANIVRDRAAATEQLRLQMQYSHGIFVAELAKDPVLRAQIEGQQKLGQISIEYSKQINDERAKGNSAAVIEAITKEALVKTELEQLATAQELATIEAKRKEDYANILADLQLEYDLKYATTEEARTQLQIAYDMAKLKQQGLKDDQLAEIQRKKQENAKPKSAAATVAGRIGQLKDEIKELTKISTIAMTAADGIGNAFADSFKSLIDGSMSAQEALSSFFKSVASMFLDMAAQIIAKQMTMIILQTILKALGAVAGGVNSGGAGFDMGSGINSTGMSTFNPANSFKFAQGGVVGSPTLFKFANGGTTQTGLMGEAGPEAIMPLSRDAGGKLGVNASGLREAMGSSPGMGGAPVLNMTFETVRFGDTEYVSRDQLEMAMAQTRRQAASDGAKRGMSMTLDKLQQSPQTRNRVGIR